MILFGWVSLKCVHPVVCTRFSFADLNVSDGNFTYLLKARLLHKLNEFKMNEPKVRSIEYTYHSMCITKRHKDKTRVCVHTRDWTRARMNFFSICFISCRFGNIICCLVRYTHWIFSLLLRHCCLLLCASHMCVHNGTAFSYLSFIGRLFLLYSRRNNSLYMLCFWTYLFRLLSLI